MRTRSEMRALLADVDRRTAARDVFLCDDRPERGARMDQAKDFTRRISRLESKGAGNVGDLWDRVNELGHRLARIEAALERLVEEHECSNPDGKKGKPCGVCGLAAAMTDVFLPRGRESDVAAATSLAASELAAAVSNGGGPTGDTVEIEPPLFGSDAPPSKSPSSSSSKRKGH
jgi:hypothetical protein